MAKALVDQSGITKGRLGDTQGELAAARQWWLWKARPKEQLAKAWSLSGVAKRDLGDREARWLTSPRW